MIRTQSPSWCFFIYMHIHHSFHRKICLISFRMTKPLRQDFIHYICDLKPLHPLFFSDYFFPSSSSCYSSQALYLKIFYLVTFSTLHTSLIGFIHNCMRKYLSMHLFLQLIICFHTE